MSNIYTVGVETKRINIGKSQKVKDKIVYYGNDNRYPSLMSSVIDKSQTAVSCVNTYSKFLSTPFVHSELEKVAVGKTSTGKNYTLKMLKKDIAKSLAKNNGCYILVNKNINGAVVSAEVIDFSTVRFSEPDDTGRSNYCYVGDWSAEIIKDGRISDKFFKYPLYNSNFEVYKEMSKSTGTTASIYHIFLDNQYIYPQSVFEQVIYDMSTENEIQSNRYEEITQGSPAKLVIRTDFSEDETKRKDELEHIKNFMGSKGERVLIIKTAFDETGSPISNGYSLDTIPDTRDLDSFSNAEKACANNIRKAINIPAILIDYESATGINVSAEQMKSAVDYFDSLCEDTRAEISQCLEEIFSNTVISLPTNDFSMSYKTIRE